MNPKQISAIIIVLIASGYLLYATGVYWYADTRFAAGSNSVKAYFASQNSNYLVTAYQNQYDAVKANQVEPAILSEFGLSASYLALGLRENATASAQLAAQADSASNQAISTSPNHPNYYKTRARTMIILSELDPKYLQLAIEALLSAQKISPTDPRIPYNLGLITHDKKYFQQALDLKPDFADAQKQIN